MDSVTKPTAVIFDFNGVMVDDFAIAKGAWSAVSELIRGCPVSDEEMRSTIRGVPTEETIRWLGGGRLSEAEVIELSEKRTQFARDLYENDALFKLRNGLPEFLDFLVTHKVPFTISTSSTTTLFRVHFERLGFNRWFDWDKIVTNDGSHPGKPAPDPYILAARLLGVEPVDCVIFEDAVSGVLSAYAAGCRNIIAVNVPEMQEKLLQHPGVVRGISDFSEITVADLVAIDS